MQAVPIDPIIDPNQNHMLFPDSLVRDMDGHAILGQFHFWINPVPYIPELEIKNVFDWQADQQWREVPYLTHENCDSTTTTIRHCD